MCYLERVSKRALFVVGILAVFLSGVFPGGVLCALADAADHACCAERTPEPTSSCCSSMDEVERTAESGTKFGCDCVHPSPTPVTMVASAGPTGPDDPLDTDQTLDRTHPESPATVRYHSVERRVRSHPPLPVFLLNCSLLI